ncbi:DUF2933 family protein [Scopulibacillus darangshiensis]|uniref:DUF2933 family protein n=1 Tax=Scopulibacillus darangshiensis TaxID=442528 RepID=A0A4R2P4L7_9BACL|nr:DUF2933 domain-containing protein [Scopulibacillus darangshiensis]TCP28891.1 DUF2933 family protein [Scopulibacillus darangshiensis]
MEWTLLLLFVCPLMMMVCMKVMLSKHKNNKDKGDPAQSEVQNQQFQPDLQALHIRIADLTEQNENLREELEIFKSDQSKSSIISMEGDKNKGADSKVEIS